MTTKYEARNKGATITSIIEGETQVKRYLAAVFGPLGPVEGLKSFDAALDWCRENGTNVAQEMETVVFRSDVPDYLRGLSRSELHNRTADWLAAHRDF